MHNFNIVLYEPEIPQNTGNIGRTCVATNCSLHLIEPLGFRIDDKLIKRAGMDYWKDLNVKKYMDYCDFIENNPDARIFYISTKGSKSYTEAEFLPGDYLMFGKESGGISKEILDKNRDKCIRIPMFAETRSLNLSNSVGIVLYEAFRQNGFLNLK